MSEGDAESARAGLIAIDKIGNRALFLDPVSYETVLTLDGFAPRLHELCVCHARGFAYVPVYGDGIHGRNPHPGHLIAVFDLRERRHAGDFSTYPYLAPHGLGLGKTGQLYCLCENSGVVLEMDPTTGRIEHVIEVGSNKAHRMEVMPDGSKLYTENEEDAFASVVDLQARTRVGTIRTPHGLSGIALSPDGRTLALVDAECPQLFMVDTATDSITRTIVLDGHDGPAQIARYSPNGKWLVVTSVDAALATILDVRQGTQHLLRLGQGPMNMAFHPDGRSVLIANQNEGTLALCDLQRAEVLRTIQAGEGVEALSFF
jgi:DNA-binding beta-propeller fold protein YncE